MKLSTGLSPSGSSTLLERSHPTPMGVMYSFWTPQGLYRITWSSPSALGANRYPVGGGSDLQRQIADFDRAIAAYFDGDCGLLDSVQVDPATWTPFFATVYRICRDIPAGETLTYGQLAERAGSPRAARAVGQAMATNRTILVIPCHRVVASGGRLGGYGGPGGLETKRWLIDHEKQFMGKLPSRGRSANPSPESEPLGRRSPTPPA